MELLILYRCPECGHRWFEVYESACDSECGECFCENISPLAHRELDPDAEFSASEVEA